MRLRPKNIRLVIFTFLVMLSSYASARSTEDAKRPVTIYAECVFGHSQDVGSVVALLDRYRLKPIMLESDFAVGGESVHDFYPVKNAQQYNEVGGLYREARRSFLLDMISLDLAGSAFAADLRNEQEAMNRLVHSEDPIMTAQVTFAGSYEDVQLFANENSGVLERLEVLADGRQRVHQKRTILQPASASTSSTWYPNSGSTGTDESGAEGERFVVQYMKWKKHSFGSSATYEHDFFLYNYNSDGTYLSSASTLYPDCMPKTTYTATTWPSSAKPYVDTRFYFDRQPLRTGCEKTEIPYTIGVAKANVLENGKSYYTYIRTVRGNVSRDKFKVQAQLGHRSPSSCYTTWCSFGDQRTSLVPAWSEKIPGSVNWTKQ